MERKRKIILVFLALILTGAVFSGGYFFAKFQTECPACKPEEVDFSLFGKPGTNFKKNLPIKKSLILKK